jgi:hypothetical protein
MNPCQVSLKEYNDRIIQEMIQGMINRYKEEREENSKFNILERRALERFPSDGQRIIRNILKASHNSSEDN